MSFFDKHKIPSLKHDMNDYVKFIKSLKDRVQPQPKQEWSEEDIKALNRISAILVDASEVKNWWKKNRLIEKDEMIRLTNFFKSLRPQNTWKPSDEQMAALEDAIYHVDDAVATQIAKLIGDLKNI